MKRLDLMKLEGTVLTRVQQEQLNGLLENQHKLIDNLMPDLEIALNLIRDYQRTLKSLHCPDKNYVTARNLLTKYGMSVGATPTEEFRVYCDGMDITEHPDSIPGSAAEAEEIDGAETPELVEGTVVDE